MLRYTTAMQNFFNKGTLSLSLTRFIFTTIIHLQLIVWTL